MCSMPTAGFEPAIPTKKWLQTYALTRPPVSATIYMILHNTVLVHKCNSSFTVTALGAVKGFGETVQYFEHVWILRLT
jgi:hypothetical protein